MMQDLKIVPDNNYHPKHGQNTNLFNQLYMDYISNELDNETENT